MTRVRCACSHEDGPCDFHERRAEDRQAAREEPLYEGEIEALENAYEAGMDRMWES